MRVVISNVVDFKAQSEQMTDVKDTCGTKLKILNKAKDNWFPGVLSSFLGNEEKFWEEKEEE